MKAPEVNPELGCVPRFNPGEVVHQMPRVGRIDDGKESQSVDEGPEAGNTDVRKAREIDAGLFEAFDSCLNRMVGAESLRKVGVKQPPVAEADFV